MSHYTVAVIVPASAVLPPDELPLVTPGDVSDLVDEALEPFDENLVVDPYSNPVDAFHLSLLIKLACEKGLLLIPAEITEQPSELKASNEWVRALTEAVGIGALLEACSAVSHDEGLHIDSTGEIAQLTSVNPQGRWDWFTIGGRWSGKFDSQRGRDVLRISEIDWADLEQRALVAAAEQWDALAENAPEKLEGRDRASFIASESKTYLPTAALLTPDGEWHEPSRIGWFGTSHSETMSEADWARFWTEKVQSQDEDSVLVLVDCHT
jgi:hypothetical protein